MFDDMKEFNGQAYTGMRVGGTHLWHYDNGLWTETKEAPDQWSFQFNCTKGRAHSAPPNTGALVQTKYHWYILADQIATKIDENSYLTEMKGVKFKVGHQRPHWRHFSYEYPEQVGYNERIIAILEQAIRQLRGESAFAPVPAAPSVPSVAEVALAAGKREKAGLDHWL
jgi:hypothetical protein